MSDNYEQPVEPMSRAEDILRGNTSTVPMSRIEALLKQIIEGGGGGGSTVTISTDYQAGTKIATLTIDGTDYNIYIPTDQIGSIVSISTDYQAGTKIATLTIDNTPYNIYIPQDQIGAKTYNGITDPAVALGNDGDLYFKLESTGEVTEVSVDLSNVVPRTWSEVSNPSGADAIKFKAHVSRSQGSWDPEVTISTIPVYPSSVGFWAYNQYNYINISRSEDSTIIYIDLESDNSYISNGRITVSDFAISDEFIKKNGSWIQTKTKGYEYSTTEHVVGVWIDGRPLYSLTQTVTLSSGITAGHNQILQLDTTYEIHSASCIGLEGGIHYLLPYATTEGCVTPLINDAGYFDLYITGTVGFNSGSKFEITIQYTKSTDTVANQ